MRILLIEPGATWATADVSAGLRYGLEHHGIELVRYALDQRIDRSNRWLSYNWRRIKRSKPNFPKPNDADVFYEAGIGALAMALRHQVDFVLVVSAMFLHPDVIILMKRAGLRVVVLFTESPYDIKKELEVAAIVDGCWTNERSSVQAFRSVNKQSGYMPHGWHPDRHKPGPQPEDKSVAAHDVVFVGSAFQDRIEWLDSIDWTGIDLGLYGSWDSLSKRHRLQKFIRGSQVDNPMTACLYRRAKIGLNLYRTSKGWGPNPERIEHAESLNPRAYELAACGAFTISTYRQEVNEMFGTLVPTFNTSFEASALIRAWLADDDGRARIQAELPSRVSGSSWTERAQMIIGDLQTLLQQRAA